MYFIYENLHSIIMYYLVSCFIFHSIFTQINCHWFFFFSGTAHSSQACVKWRRMYWTWKVSSLVEQTIHCKLDIWLVSMCMFLYKFVIKLLQYPLTGLCMLSLTFDLEVLAWKPMIDLRNNRKFNFIIVLVLQFDHVKGKLDTPN